MSRFFLVDAYFSQERAIDRRAHARLGILNPGVYANFDGCSADMRDIGNHDDRVIQESALFEFKVFNRDSRDIHARVPHGGDAGDLIDPLEQFATEEAILAVDVHIAQEVGGFGAGVSYDGWLRCGSKLRFCILFHTW